MTAPNMAEKVCRGTPSQSAHAPYSVDSSMSVSPMSKTTARKAGAGFCRCCKGCFLPDVVRQAQGARLGPLLLHDPATAARVGGTRAAARHSSRTGPGERNGRLAGELTPLVDLALVDICG